MNDPLLIGKGQWDQHILPRMANRHGLVAGATGTGKTITLQVIAEKLSRIGVPVFAADVKGDLSGISQLGKGNPRVTERATKLGLTDFQFQSCPVVFWDIFGQQGHPIRTTVSEMGPLLLSRILSLNETQSGVLSLVFKIADDSGLMLLDLKDLQSMIRHVGDNATEYTTQYGNISAASIGAIQRGLLQLDEQGGSKLFGEPGLNLLDFIQTVSSGQGVVNILTASSLMQFPKLYSSFLLWMLSELYETLPEVGDLDKPKLVFFFDEAHLLFNDAPPNLLNKIEQVVRLIRSKGVGIYFITQNPLDIPDTVLGQLGNRIQHALHAFTPRDQKAVKAAAQTFRVNPKLDVESAIIELGVGEALISLLDEKGIPGVVDRALICPPESQIGAINDAQRQQIIQSSAIFGFYERIVDRESAYELLKVRADQAARAAANEATEAEASKEMRRPRPAKRSDSVTDALAKSAARAIGSQVGRQIIRGVLGSIFGGRR
ncbi:MAG: helicase HerA-like domain-containing protein [Armatimonadota bacterium]